MSYKFTTDKIELRGNFDKNIFINGYAIAKGLDSYGTKFSDKAMQSIASQLLKKDVRVGSQHYNALTERLSNRMKELQNLITNMKGKGENVDKYENMLAEMQEYTQKRNFTDAVPVEAKFDGNGVFISAKLNKWLQKVDPEYFQALYGQLKDGFLNGYSIEFSEPSTHDEWNEQTGKYETIIDDVNIAGVNFVSNASNPNSRITEVAVRMALDSKKESEEKNMTEEKKEQEEQPKQEEKNPEVNPEKLKEELKEELKKDAEEEAKKKAEEEQKAKEESEKTENQKMAEEIQKLQQENQEFKEAVQKIAEEKSKEMPTAKGLVKPPENNVPESQQVIEKINNELKEKSMEELLKIQDELKK